jgi:hypothetical protein
MKTNKTAKEALAAKTKLVNSVKIHQRCRTSSNRRTTA